jgi:thymidylate kinase
MSGGFRLDSADIVFDGHDGAGKSTFAKLVAQALGGVYVKPFDDSLGDHMSWLWKQGRLAETNALALSAIERAVDLNPEGPRVFDRHWATLFSILPEEFWQPWNPLPITVICHADAATTYRRLQDRGEDPRDLELHERYQRIYSELGARFDALVIDTTSRPIESCVRAALDFYANRSGVALREV